MLKAQHPLPDRIVILGAGPCGLRMRRSEVALRGELASPSTGWSGDVPLGHRSGRVA